ncbi:MAG: hypothetical protein M0Q94_14820 [Candidatus Cloacimonetes bacterium]|nr:hypothetical protein [Candidatus Cloacimonadota bacterium]
MPLGNNFSVSYFGRTFINFHHEVYTETTEEEVDEIFDTFLSKKLDVDISFQKDLPTKRINACLEATSKFI